MIHLTWFTDFTERVLPVTLMKNELPAEILFQAIATVATLFGVYAGYSLYYRNKSLIEQWKLSPFMMGIRNFFYSGWAFDQLYEFVFVKPFLFITHINKADIFDSFYNGIANFHQRLNRMLSVSQNGSLRWYIAGVLIGILFILTMQLVR
jgi:NADH-quinone oxidoreductase subunit L